MKHGLGFRVADRVCGLGQGIVDMLTKLDKNSFFLWNFLLPILGTFLTQVLEFAFCVAGWVLAIGLWLFGDFLEVFWFHSILS